MVGSSSEPLLRGAVAGSHKLIGERLVGANGEPPPSASGVAGTASDAGSGAAA